MTLRVFLTVLFTLAGVVFSFADEIEPPSKIFSQFSTAQQQAVKELQEAGLEIHPAYSNRSNELRVWFGREVEDISDKVYRLGDVPGVISLSLPDFTEELPDPSLRHLSRLSGLRRLSLGRCQFSEKSILYIKSLPNITDLSLGWVRPPEEKEAAANWLSQLKELSSLEELDLSSFRFDPSALEQLRELKQLRRLFLQGSQVKDENLAFLNELSQLEKLDISYTAVTDEGFKHFSNLRSLKDLLGHGMDQLTGAGFRYLRDLENLNRLFITAGDQKPIDNQAISYLANLPELRTLILESGGITDEGLKSLSSVATLELLILRYSQIQGSGVAALAGLDALEELRLDHANLTDEGLKGFRGKFQNLKYLSLWNNPGITNQGLKNISALPELEFVNLSNTEVTYLGLQYLSRHPKLVKIEIPATQEVTEELPNLTGFDSLKIITLDKRPQVGDEALQKQINMIRRALPRAEIEVI